MVNDVNEMTHKLRNFPAMHLTQNSPIVSVF